MKLKTDIPVKRQKDCYKEVDCHQFYLTFTSTPTKGTGKEKHLGQSICRWYSHCGW